MSKHTQASDFTILDAAGRGPEGSRRGALRAWLARLIDTDPATLAEPSALATPFENRVRKLRAEAHAAFRSVDGARRLGAADAAALDGALDVIEEEWRAAVAERDRCAEALKAIRVYSPHAGCRAMAAQGLSGGAPRWGRSRGTSGVGRFPFMDESDA
jgi:hypothetical protein